MNRKKFLERIALSSAAMVTAPVVLNASTTRKSDYDKLMEQVGYNHLPNKEEKTMNTVIHKAATRGNANHGWLNSYHTFSFANYRNAERMNFGVLRVLNDDTVAPGQGFGRHPHDNMEIISIPLAGDLEHQDSMGNTTVIKEGDIQVMSAGTGVFHSEYNKNAGKEVKFLQIWLFPNKRNVEPRYDQISLADNLKMNTLQQILSPNQKDQGVWIHQNAWFSMGVFNQITTVNYKLNDNNNGVYVFVLNGDVTVAGQPLNARDGMGIWNEKEFEITAQPNAKLLLMEVPMEI